MASQPPTDEVERASNTRGALVWSLFSVYATRGAKLLGTVVLARILLPEDFGVMAMAWAFLAFIANFGSLGLPAYIVRLPRLDQRTLNTVFWLNLTIAALLALVTLAVAPLAGLVYRDPRVGEVLAVLSLVTLSIGLSPVPAGLLRRRMRFGRLAIVDLGQAASEVCTSVSLAALGYGVWALVCGTLAGRAARISLLYVVQPFVPALAWCRRAARDAVGFATGMLGTSVSTVIGRNIDNAIIGAGLGAHGLGLYAFANRLMRMPGEDLVGSLVRVLVPRLAAARDDNEMASLVRRSVGASAAVVGPILVTLAVTAPWLVPLVFGQKWTYAVPLFQILAPVAILQSALRVPLQVYIVKGRTRLLFAWTAFYTAVCLGALLCGLPFGLYGVAVACVVAHALLIYPWIRLPKLALPTLNVRQIAIDLAIHGLIAGFAATLGCVTVYLLEQRTSTAISHATAGAIVLLTFATLYLTLRPIGIDDLLAMIFPNTLRKRIALLVGSDRSRCAVQTTDQT